MKDRSIKLNYPSQIDLFAHTVDLASFNLYGPVKIVEQQKFSSPSHGPLRLLDSTILYFHTSGDLHFSRTFDQNRRFDNEIEGVYNEHGLPLTFISSERGEEGVKKTTMKYDSADRLILISKGDKSLKVFEYSATEDSEPSSIKIIESGDTTRFDISYEYDREGNMLSCTQTDITHDGLNSVIYSYRYDEEGRIAESIVDRVIIGTRRTVYKYRRSRLLSDSTFFNNDLISIRVYNKNQNVISEELFSNSGSVKQTWRYQYDSYRNWTLMSGNKSVHQENKSNTITSETFIRKIEYYVQ